MTGASLLLTDSMFLCLPDMGSFDLVAGCCVSPFRRYCAKRRNIPSFVGLPNSGLGGDYRYLLEEEGRTPAGKQSSICILTFSQI